MRLGRLIRKQEAFEGEPILLKPHPMTLRRLFLLISVTSLLLASAYADAQGFRLEKSGIPLHRESGYWLSDWVEITIPAGLTSFQIVVQGSSDQLLQVTDLIAPDGQAFVSSGNAQSAMTGYSQPVLRNVVSLNRSIGVVPGTGSLIVPNNPELSPIPGGVWRFRSLTHREPSDKTVSFTVIGKRLSQETRIEAVVWISPETHWGQDKQTLSETLASAKQLLGEAGLELDIQMTVTLEHPVEKLLSPPADMTAIALKKNDPDKLNIYLMGEMEFQRGAVNGLACLGGPVGLKQPHGCFVSMYAKPNAMESVSTKEQGQILAHEIAHYLGIFHTKDSGYILINEVLDPLSDTSTQVTGFNMMDPGERSIEAVFSPLQMRMMKLSPLLK